MMNNNKSKTDSFNKERVSAFMDYINETFGQTYYSYLIEEVFEEQQKLNDIRTKSKSDLKSVLDSYYKKLLDNVYTDKDLSTVQNRVNTILDELVNDAFPLYKENSWGTAKTKERFAIKVVGELASNLLVDDGRSDFDYSCKIHEIIIRYFASDIKESNDYDLILEKIFYPFENTILFRFYKNNEMSLIFDEERAMNNRNFKSYLNSILRYLFGEYPESIYETIKKYNSLYGELPQISKKSIIDYINVITEDHDLDDVYISFVMGCLNEMYKSNKSDAINEFLNIIRVNYSHYAIFEAKDILIEKIFDNNKLSFFKWMVQYNKSKLNSFLEALTDDDCQLEKYLTHDEITDLFSYFKDTKIYSGVAAIYARKFFPLSTICNKFKYKLMENMPLQLARKLIRSADDIKTYIGITYSSKIKSDIILKPFLTDGLLDLKLNFKADDASIDLLFNLDDVYPNN